MQFSPLRLRNILVSSLIMLSFVSVTLAANSSPTNQGREIPTGPRAISVKESVQYTLKEHRSLKAIQENRQAVEHERDRAQKGYFPRVDVYGATGMSQNSDTTTRSVGRQSDTQFYSGSRAGASLVQPVWDGLATRSKVRIAESTLNSMTHRVVDNGTTLALESVMSHINVLRTREIYKLAVDNVQRHNTLKNQVIDRQRSGADSLADVSQAKSRHARAQSQAADAQDTMLAAEIYYARLTNVSVTGMRLISVPAPPFPYKNARDIENVAQTHNAKLLALLQDVQTAQGGMELNEANYHPTVNVEAGPNYMNRGVGGKAEQWTRNVDAMVSMRWNLFNSGADADAVKASRARIRQARQTMFDFKDELSSAVETTWVSFETAKEQSKLYSEAAKYSGKTLGSYKEQFVLGQRSLLDVLDIENELFNNSVQAVTAKHNIVAAQYRAVALAGILLSELGIDSKELLQQPTPTQRRHQ